jgi:molybdate transport system substrate-binding protein
MQILADRLMSILARCLLAGLSVFPTQAFALDGVATRTLVIAASPSLAVPVETLSRRFEATHPDVRVRIYFDSGLALRQTIATMENRGRYFIGTGPIHLLAPGGDELIARLQHRYYVLPGTAVAYASVPLVLVVPESLVEAPASLEDALRDPRIRVAVADPSLTVLGEKTARVLRAKGFSAAASSRLDIAADANGVVDHLLNGQADVAIIFGPDAAGRNQQVRVIEEVRDQAMAATVHSMAMERSCPDRMLCQEFLSFIHTAESQALLRALGYGPPPKGSDK